MAGLFKELVYVLTAASQCIAELMQAHTSQAIQELENANILQTPRCKKENYKTQIQQTAWNTIYDHWSISWFFFNYTKPDL